MKRKEARKSREKNNELLGVIFILLTAIVSGVANVMNKFFVVSIDPVVFTALRAFFIGLIFLGISLFACNFKIKKFNKVSWWYLLFIGLIGGGIAFLFFFTGLKETTAGRAAFIHKTLPLYATILAFFFLKEKITKKHVISMLLMLLGVYFIESSKISAGMRSGDLLVLGATILWAVESTVAKKVILEKESNWVVTFSRMFFGSLLLFAILFFADKVELLYSLSCKQMVYIAISGFLLLLYVLFWYWGLKFISLSKASNLLLIAPIISLALGYYWLREQVFTMQLLGSALILVGAYIITRIKSEKRVEEI